MELLEKDLDILCTSLNIHKDDLIYLSSGAFSKVYEIRNRPLVVKIFKKLPQRDGEYLAKLQDIEYYPSLALSDKKYLVMQKADGIALCDWIEKGNVVNESILKQVRDAILQTMEIGIRPIELEPDHVIYNEVTKKIKIIDVGMYRFHPFDIEIVESTFNNFVKHCSYWQVS